MDGKLYDLEIELSSSDGGFPRGSFKDRMRVRLHGHSSNRTVMIPVIAGAVSFKNDGKADVALRHGVSMPIHISRNEIAEIWFDGAGGMAKVGV